jgi:hypothetical protein
LRGGARSSLESAPRCPFLDFGDASLHRVKVFQHIA